MSEENQSVDTAEVTETQEAPQPSFGVNDLKLMANVLEVVSRRGAIRANEMAAVGTLYNNLMNFLIASGVVQVQQPEVGEEAPVGEDGEAEVETTEENTDA